MQHSARALKYDEQSAEIAPKMPLFAQLIALCALPYGSPPPILGSYFEMVPLKTRCALRSVRYERVPDRAFKVGCAKSYPMAR